MKVCVHELQVQRQEGKLWIISIYSTPEDTMTH